MSRCRLLGTDDIALGVLKLDQPTDGRDFTLRHDNLASIRRDGGRGGVDVGDGYGAFITRHALAGHDFMPLLQGPLNSGILLVARRNQEETRRSPRLEAPVENVFVEATRPRQVVGMYSKKRKIARHVEVLVRW